MSNNLRQSNLFVVFISAAKVYINKFFHKKSIPMQVGKYTLTSSIIKNKPGLDNNFLVGIYASDGVSYFIKTWQGRVKDLNYYYLLNEYMVNSTLYFYLSSQKVATRVSTPKLIECVAGDCSLSLVYEYVPGRLLVDCPVDEQVSTMQTVLDLFSPQYTHVLSSTSGVFAVRGFLFYCVALPILFLIAVIKNPRHIVALIGMVGAAFVRLFSLKGVHKILAHRDLNPQNVLVTDDCLYIIDFERMALTYPHYDAANFVYDPVYKSIASMMRLSPPVSTASFVYLYIVLRHAAFDGVLERIII